MLNVVADEQAYRIAAAVGPASRVVVSCRQASAFVPAMLGSWLAGRWADAHYERDRGAPLRAYGWCELAIAAGALALRAGVDIDGCDISGDMLESGTPYLSRQYRNVNSTAGRRAILPSQLPVLRNCPTRIYATSRKLAKGDSATMAWKGTSLIDCSRIAAPIDSPIPIMLRGFA